MSTMTLRQYLDSCKKAEAATQKLPAPVLAGLGETAIAALTAASAASGGVKATDFHYRKPRSGQGQASAAIVGSGFAVLDEFGSYKKPRGYEIEPQYGIGRGIYGKNRAILGNKRTGFAAAYVTKHPPIKAHPYVAKAEVVIAQAADKAFDAAMVGVLLKAFH